MTILRDSAFRRETEKLLLEHRKLRGAVVLCLQEAGSLVSLGIQDIVLEQCPTRILFPKDISFTVSCCVGPL